MARKTIESKTTGLRMICGTEWPVSDELIRDQRPGAKKVDWIVVRSLCNGAPASSTSYRTLREARDNF